MPETRRNDPCPCGSGRKYKACHGSPHPARRPMPRPEAEAESPAIDRDALENPFRRIFKPDGTFDEAYVRSRMQRLEELLRTRSDFFPIRFDREVLEETFAANQDLFASSGNDAEYEAAFTKFAALVLPKLVTKEFDEKVKEALTAVVHDKETDVKDRAAAASGLIFTLPEEGKAPIAVDRNPFFDLVLRVTFNESMDRIQFFRKLGEMKDLSEAEANARISEFLRSVPAILYEFREGVNRLVRKAMKSYERGEFSFGLSVDMALHGVRAIRRLSVQFSERDTAGLGEEDRKKLSEQFGEALKASFTEDIGEDEESEVLARMAAFLAEAKNAGAERAANGLEAALSVMERDHEVRRRMIFAAYHEAVTGRRLYRSPPEEDCVRDLFKDPLVVAPYLAYGACLESEQDLLRAERVYRAALEFFPEDAEVRARLATVGEALKPMRDAAVQKEIEDTEKAEASAEAGEAPAKDAPEPPPA